MVQTLLIACGLTWFLVLLHQISHRGLTILLIWLCLAPMVTNLVQGRTNPFFETPQERALEKARTDIFDKNRKYKTGSTSFDLYDVLDPTRMLFGAFLLVLLLGSIGKQRRVVRLDGTETWMAIFSVLLVASAYLQSIRFAWSMHSVLDAFITPFLGYYIARRLVTSEASLRQVIKVLGYFGLGVIMICVIERLAHKDLLYRLHGPFEDQIKLLMVLATVFFALLIEPRAIPSGIRWFVLGLTPIIVLLTWQRSSWFGFSAGLWFFVFLGSRLGTPLRKLPQVGIGLILLPVLILGVQSLMSEETINYRITSENSGNWRLQRWEIAVQEGIEHPLFGIGLTNLQNRLGNAGLNYSTAHNSFLTFFAEQGLVGLGVYLAIMISIIRMSWNLYRRGTTSQDKWRGVAIIAIVATVHLPSVFYNALHSYTLGQAYAYVFIGGIAGLYSQPHSATVPYTISQHLRLRHTS